MKKYIIAVVMFSILAGVISFDYYAFIDPIFKLNIITKYLLIAIAIIPLAVVTTIVVVKNRSIKSTSKMVLIFSIDILFMILILSIVHEVISLFYNSDYLTIIMLALFYIYILFSLIGGYKKPKIYKVDIQLKKIKKDMKIIQLSDIHIDANTTTKQIKSIIDISNSLNPDIVVITGDLIDGDIDKLEHLLPYLNNLETEHGVYYVNGNHEYFHGLENIIKRVKKLNMTVLENNSVIIDNNINLIGVNDLSGSRFGHNEMDIDKAFSSINKNLSSILLAHQPKVIKYLKGHTPDLILSGHTHAGQIFPFNLLVKIDQPFVRGLNRLKNGIMIYINRGTGYWGAPLRFLAPSEITLLNIRSKNE